MDVNIYAAKTQLSSLVRRVAEGEDIVITRNGRPVARLVPIGHPGKRRKLGRLRGRIGIPEGDADPTPASPPALGEET